MPLQLVVVTPERQIFDAPVDDVVLPGSEGDFGVLERHERLLAALRIGEARIRRGSELHYAAVNGGFADVSQERVVVMAETFELAEDIDLARAQAARASAERSIEEIRESEVAEGRLRVYELALQRAIIRIQVAGRRGRA